MKKVVHIKAHVRRLKNGKTVRVREHDVYRYLGTTRKSLGDVMRDKKSRGKELERLMKLREKKLKEFSIKTEKPLEDKIETPKKEQPQTVVSQSPNKPYKPTKEDYNKGFHVFDNGSVKYYPKTVVKRKKDDGVSFTSEERKKGFKLEYTSDGTAKVHYTDDALKNMDI